MRRTLDIILSEILRHSHRDGYRCLYLRVGWQVGVIGSSGGSYEYECSILFLCLQQYWALNKWTLCDTGYFLVRGGFLTVGYIRPPHTFIRTNGIVW